MGPLKRLPPSWPLLGSDRLRRAGLLRGARLRALPGLRHVLLALLSLLALGGVVFLLILAAGGEEPATRATSPVTPTEPSVGAPALDGNPSGSGGGSISPDGGSSPGTGTSGSGGGSGGGGPGGYGGGSSGSGGAGGSGGSSSSGGAGSAGTGASSAIDTGPQTYRRSVRLHVHEWSLRWFWEGPFLLLVAVGLLVLAVRRQAALAWLRGAGAPGIVALLVVGVVAASTAVTVPNSPARERYAGKSSETRELENGDREIVTTREYRHRHEPIEIIVPWVFIELGTLALLGARLTDRRRGRRTRLEPATTPVTV